VKSPYAAHPDAPPVEFRRHGIGSFTPKRTVEPSTLFGFRFQGFIQIGIGIAIAFGIGIGNVDPRPATFDPRRSTGTPAFPTPQAASRRRFALENVLRFGGCAPRMLCHSLSWTRAAEADTFLKIFRVDFYPLHNAYQPWGRWVAGLPYGTVVVPIVFDVTEHSGDTTRW
jgi:hypothetical protein